MEIGKTNSLRVCRVDNSNIWLDAGNGKEVLLVLKANEEAPRVDTVTPVFIYTTATGEPRASLKIARVDVDETALLEIVSRTDAGLWLDWGLTQDLLLPRSELSQPISADQAFVYVFGDDDGSICASTRFHHFYSEHTTSFRRWDKVSMVIAAESRLGYKAIIDGEFLGLLYSDEVFQPLKPGDLIDGYVKQVRDDGRIDLTLYPEKVTIKDELGKRILAQLHSAGGVSTLTDRSPPEEIYQRYQVSKKNYKRALSGLYKARLISLDDNRITLVDVKPGN